MEQENDDGNPYASPPLAEETRPHRHGRNRLFVALSLPWLVINMFTPFAAAYVCFPGGWGMGFLNGYIGIGVVLTLISLGIFVAGAVWLAGGKLSSFVFGAASVSLLAVSGWYYWIGVQILESC